MRVNQLCPSPKGKARADGSLVVKGRSGCAAASARALHQGPILWSPLRPRSDHTSSGRDTGHTGDTGDTGDTGERPKVSRSQSCHWTMPAKTPIYLKAPTDRKGRRPKLRDILSGDMISRPLGDVRHSAHVGPQGQDDMFGDVAFLQGSMDILPSLRAPHNGHEPSPQAVSPHQDPLQWGLISQDQAPPKPPRLHLDPPPQHGATHYPHLDPPPQHGPTQYPHLDMPHQHGSAHYPHLDTPHQHGPAPGPHHRDISLAYTIQRLVTSSGSSSEDSLFDTCGPLGVTQGLSLDSDAALSNEDLRSEGSPTTLPRTDSMLASLNLDLGPSIMEDVLSIMDRYRGPSVSQGP